MGERWIRLGRQEMVNGSRVVAVGGAQSAGMRRLLGSVSPQQIVDLTAGRRRESVLLLDDGHVVLTALTMEELRLQLEQEEVNACEK